MEILEKIQEIQRYTPKKGDILFVTLPDDYSYTDMHELRDSLRKEFNKHGFDEDYCSIYILIGNVKMEVLRKEE